MQLNFYSSKIFDSGLFLETKKQKSKSKTFSYILNYYICVGNLVQLYLEIVLISVAVTPSKQI